MTLGRAVVSRPVTSISARYGVHWLPRRLEMLGMMQRLEFVVDGRVSVCFSIVRYMSS